MPFENLPGRLQERLTGIVNIDVTAQARIASWQLGGKILDDNPWLGVGYNHLYWVKHDYDPLVVPSHAAAGFDSSLLTIAVGTGTIGLILFLIIYCLVFRRALQTYKDKAGLPYRQGVALALLAIFVALFLHSQFVNSLLYPQLLIVFWYLVGLLYLAPKKVK